jgi:pantoate--beta-alanine ligase
MRERLLAGEGVSDIESWAMTALQMQGFQPDYAVLRRPDALDQAAERGPGAWVALIAARLGTTRLIDNLEFSLPEVASSGQL